MVLNPRSTKKKFNLALLSPEERKLICEKSAAARAVNTAARKSSSLRRDFLDDDLWSDLARKRKLRLPSWGKPATMSNMRTYLHRTGWSQAQFEEWAGCSLHHFTALNREWPLRAIIGIVLEVQKEQNMDRKRI